MGGNTAIGIAAPSCKSCTQGLQSGRRTLIRARPQMPPRPVIAILTAGALAHACLSCSTMGDAWMTGWTQRAATDQMMLVDNPPPTLGWQRLDFQRKVYPDLDRFLAAAGLPDFLAETINDGRRYLVLYYLDTRRAFACRTNRPDDRSMEFAGPYPITQREFELLRELQRRHREASTRPPASKEKPTSDL